MGEGAPLRPAIRVVAADWPVLRGLSPGRERVEGSVEDAPTVTADLALLLVGPDDRPLQGLGGFIDWKANGSLASLLSRAAFVGRRGEKLLRPAESELPFERMVLFGIGRPAEWAHGEATAVAHELINCARQMRAASVALGWVAEASDSELWSEVFEALVSALRKVEVAAPGPLARESSRGGSDEIVAVESSQAVESREDEGAGSDEEPAGEPQASPPEELTREEPAPSALLIESLGEGEDAPDPGAKGSEDPSTDEQWWIVAPEALCTRLRGRVLGTPRAAGAT